MSTIDYRLAKRATLRALQTGMVSRIDVCDAHPELLRAARHIGEHAMYQCPICESRELKLVLYAYGKDLKRGNGYARTSAELPELRTRPGEIACYIVEVCPDCTWNHLVRSFLTGGRRAAG